MVLDTWKDGVIPLFQSVIWVHICPAPETTAVLTLRSPFPGWEVAGDHIYTAVGASDNDFMILTLVVPGFR